MATDIRPAWHALSADEALAAAAADSSGLSSAEAAARLSAHGPNVIPRGRKDGPFRVLLRQVESPLVWVLAAAAAVAIAVGKVDDGLIVLAVVVLNTIVGFVQEFRAGRAIEALGGMVAEQATVLRDGTRTTVETAALVPGDVVLLAAGDKVPADARVLAQKNLHVDESALTGESLPVAKREAPVAADAGLGDRTSLVFGGTLATAGTGTAVVVATGAGTELGRISALMREAGGVETPLARALARIGRLLTVGILVVAAVLFAVGTARSIAHGLPLDAALREMLVFAIALAVGAIPEGLPAIVTIALAVGVRRMAARRAIVRRLPAVETLGSTTVICSDKTGTLTRNEMTAVRLWTPAAEIAVSGTGYEPRGTFDHPDAHAIVTELLEAAALCNDSALAEAGGAWRITGDPTEGALVVVAAKAGIDVEALRRAAPRADEVPFSSEAQWMATLHAAGAARRLVLKGAPEVVLARTAGDSAAALDAAHRFAGQGLRVLAVATRAVPAGQDRIADADVAAGFRLLGLVGLLDPPRAEAIEAVAACRAAGIRVKMITGDHGGTAQAIGARLGLAGAAVTGRELAVAEPATLGDVATRTDVFARVAPEHKLQLVRALQERGEVVAMTGDGVNDAPALEQADIGVAMGITGTAVSREAADLVLTDDNFATIVAAVGEGRRIFDNLLKSIVFVLPTNLGLALILVAAVVAFPFDPRSGELLLPIRATQLLWINLVAAVALALPLAFEAAEPDLMRRPPRRRDAPLLDGGVVARIAVAAVAMTLAAVGVFLWEYAASGEDALARAQTMAVTTVIAFQVFYLQSCRALRGSALRTGPFANPWVFAGVALVLALQALYVYAPPLQAAFGSAPLGARDLAVSIAAGAAVLPLIALTKWLLGRTPRAAEVTS